MATAGNNLSEYDAENVPNAKTFKFGLVVSEWNADITQNLFQGAFDAFMTHGAIKENIVRWNVPGSFELIYGAKKMAQSFEMLDVIIVIGSVIEGETKHFDFVCQATAQGIKDVGLKYNNPAIFCVLTDNTMQQAIDRSGGKHGNKGIEAAIACMKMIELKKNLK
mgnify:CR=1 FL=1